MAINIDNEEVMSLAEAAKSLPRVNGRRPSLSTLWRWCRKGLKGVRLDYLRVGRKIVTSREAMNRFFAALAQADPHLPDAPPLELTSLQKPRRSDSAHQRAIQRAERRLAEAGI